MPQNKDKPLVYENAPDWLVAYMRYRRSVLSNTDTSTMTFFGALREYFQWLSQYKATGTQPKSEEALREISILSLPLSVALDATKNDIETYLYFLTDVLYNSPRTREKKLVAIRTFYDYVLDHQEELEVELAENPAARVRRPKADKKQPIFLPSEDQTAFLEAITGENGVRDYAIFLLFLTAGLRVSECVGIDLKDMNLRNLTIRIRGKGKKERIAHITPRCAGAIQRYIEEYRSLIPDLQTDALFVSKRQGTRLTTRSVERAMDKHIQEAKLGGMGYTPHKLRHSVGTTLAQDGVDLLTIQNVLGHEHPSTTEIYTHLTNADVAKAVNTSSLADLGMKNIQK
jgi:site-specific recombinase XerD